MKYIICLLIGLIVRLVVAAQGDMSRIVVPVANGSDSALLHLPNDYATTKTLYPLFVFGQGSGEAADGSSPGNGLAKIFNSQGSGGPAWFIAQGKFPSSFINPKDNNQYKYLVVCPQENTWSITAADLNTLLPYLVSTYRIDPTRIYLSGVSAGGQGTGEYAGQYNITSSIKIAGWVGMSVAIDAIEIPTISANIAKSGIHMWGFGDPINDLWGGNTQAIEQAVAKANPALAQFTSFSTGHGPWNPFYDPNFLSNGMNIYQWLLQFTATGNTSPPVVVTPPVTTPPSTGPPVTTAKNVRYVMTPNQDGGWINTTPAYNGGDTLEFPSKYLWTYIELDNGLWSMQKPVVIINSGGQTVMNDGMTIQSVGVHVTGTGAPGVTYGFLSTNPTPKLRSQGPFGMSILGHAKKLEIDHFAFHNVGIGIHIETDNNCDQSMDYPNWIIDTVLIHDNSIVGIWNEGVYYGNTSPDNAAYDHRPDQCNTTQTTPTFSLPMKNGYLHCWNNYIDSCGRGGIQIANAQYGISEIDSNTIKHCGLNGDDAQGTGISFGLYSSVYVHDNTIINMLTWPIACIGAGFTNVPVRIEHNTMDSAGYLVNYPAIATTSLEAYDPSTQPTAPDPFTYPYAIWIDTRPRVYTTDNPAGTAVRGKDSTQFWINNNTIGIWRSFTSKTDNPAAIQIEDHNLGIQSTGNQICGNVSSKGQPINVYTGNAGHPINYSTCGVTTTPPPIIIPPVTPTCDSAGIIKAYLATHPCPTCPTIPAPRIVTSLQITVNGLLITVPIAGAKFKFSDGGNQ